ncbi:MAG: cysteine--tRNA ligase [Nanoarchaeota archaeon]
MSLILYNTLTRKREKFIPLKKTQVGMYTCGPTVYNYAHIGNLRSYLFEDLLKRVLLFNGFKVKHVMNITDVGHLTSDADTGEDKMLKAALRENKSVWAIAEYYTQTFQEDVQKLNIIEPTIWCNATKHIKEQIDLIKKLEKKGFTYNADGNVYFDTSRLNDYGKLARLDLEAETKARIKKDLHKKNIHDFVLWFTKSKFVDQEMKWDSPWGAGYPGWHIECSAMSMKYLGEQFDIHCGGIDHIPVHHTNEIAQAEAATEKKPWVKYWMHNEFLVLGSGEKMAKSGDNFITLAVLEKNNFAPLDLRYLCLGTHYRKPLMFSYEALESAKAARKRLVEKVVEFKEAKKEGEDDKTKQNKTKQLQFVNQFTKDVNDDLNMPKALATMWEVVKEEKLSAEDKYSLLLKFDEVLGLDLSKAKKEKLKIPTEVLKLVKERQEARQNKDWKQSDLLREKIKELGYVIGDTKEGYEINKV